MTDLNKTLSRRETIAALFGAAALSPIRAVAADQCMPFAGADSGPFYPEGAIPDTRDLTQAAGGRAAGQLLYVVGNALDIDCNPAKGVRVMIWQADMHGQYKHSRAAVDVGLDPNFAYYAATHSDDEGFYLFKTILPRWYNFRNLTRAAHIHFSVQKPDGSEQMTEMYFDSAEDAERRERDVVWKSRDAAVRDTMIRPKQPSDTLSDTDFSIEEDALVCRYDLRLTA